MTQPDARREVAACVIYGVQRLTERIVVFDVKRQLKVRVRREQLEYICELRYVGRQLSR